MIKENVVEMLSCVLKRSMSLNVERSGILARLNLSWIQQHAPGFYLDSKQVQILTEPRQFYSSLLEKCSQSNKRIILASLYIGTGDMEANLIKAISKQLAVVPTLNIKVLLDCFRGSRGQVNSRSMLLPLVEQDPQRCQVSLFHTPALRGPLLSMIPQRYNELIGLQHIKLYLFDNDLIISGANLSNDYFTQRQDRYIVINDCKELADFVDGFVSKLSDLSFQLQPNNELKLTSQLHPTKTKIEDYTRQANKHISSYYESFIGRSLDTGNRDTVIFPFLEMAPFDIHQDSTITKQLMSHGNENSVIHLATGYFNLTQDYIKTILDCSKCQFNILMAHPTANGFYKAKGPAGGIPHAYTELSRQFLDKIDKTKQSFRVKMFEYQRAGWTYHGKGFWFSDGSHLPCLTLVGSPNFGERSVKRDLEMQFLLATTNNKLQEHLKQERDRLYERGTPFNRDVSESVERRTPYWVLQVVKYFRSFL